MNYEGKIQDKIKITYDSELNHIEENDRIRILSKIIRFGCQAENVTSLCQLSLEVLNEYYPHAQRKTFLTHSNNELIPRIFFPHFNKAHFSSTLANESLEKGLSFIWSKKVSLNQDLSLPSSLIKVCSAIYAPVIIRNQKIGMIHIDSISDNNAFSHKDLQLLTMIANTLAPSLVVRNSCDHDMYPKVFISYSHKDKDFVLKIARHLRKKQIRVWFDERIEVGNIWKQAISDAIKYADCLIWVASPDSIKSEVTLWEVNLARIEEKIIIPIKYKNCKLPTWALDIQWINYDQNFESLINIISARV
ncbi:Toll-Interleukin receptor domain protein [Candidatus Magnetomorum sp. HK-1]|nr:Toll-Interleukin receptor domain protein [Candidatus Magnetomorum sp. HK-1]